MDQLVFRTSVPGHEHCDHEKEPFKRPSDFKLAHLYNWDLVPANNQYMRKVLATADPSAVVLNVTYMTELRPDGHRGSKDCLHYILPGAPDWWSHLLVASLTRSVDEVQTESSATNTNCVANEEHGSAVDSKVQHATNEVPTPAWTTLAGCCKDVSQVSAKVFENVTDVEGKAWCHFECSKVVDCTSYEVTALPVAKGQVYKKGTLPQYRYKCVLYEDVNIDISAASFKHARIRRHKKKKRKKECRTTHCHFKSLITQGSFGNL